MVVIGGETEKSLGRGLEIFGTGMMFEMNLEMSLRV